MNNPNLATYPLDHPGRPHHDGIESPFRRRMMKAGIIAGISMWIGCTPLKIMLKAYPEEYKMNVALVDQILKAFVQTIIPSIDTEEKNLLQVFYDRNFPLDKHRGFLVSDLCKRSQKLFEVHRFPDLDESQRTAVIVSAEQEGGITASIYNGAIILTQVSVYSGMYDDKTGCDLIDFHGPNYGFSPDVKFYKNYENHLSYELTSSGNFY